MMTRLTNAAGSSGMAERAPASCANATTTAVTAVIGAVGPEHWMRVPPSSDVIDAMMAAEMMPANAPRPERIPNAAPRLIATKLTVRPATALVTSSATVPEPIELRCWGSMVCRP